MLSNERPYTFDRVVRLALSAVFLAALIWLLNYLSDVLIPFAVALLLAYLINPLTEAVERRVGNRLVAVLGSLVLVGATLWLAVWLVAPMIGTELRHMATLASRIADGSEFDRKALQSLPPEVWGMIKDALGQKDIQQFLTSPDVLAFAKNAVARIVPGVWGLMQGAASAVLAVAGAFIILLYLVFLLLDYRRVRDGWTSIIPPGRREAVVEFAAEFNGAMSRYFRAQAAVASIVGVLFAIGFALIGLPLGVLLGLFIGLLNMVPYLQIVGFIPAFALGVVHALETGTNVWLVLALITAVFAVVQVLQDGVLIPRIMGKVTGLSPAIILLALSIWGKLLGMLGLLIALPATCLLWAYWQRYVNHVSVAATPPDEAEG